jgi:PAS domain S-box-containing protein/putative nucleotidyltransferase with HDIG domain
MAKAITKHHNVVDLTSLKVSIDEVIRHKTNSRKARQVIEEVGKALAGLLSQIEQDESEWRDAFDAIKYPIIFHDADLRIIRANATYADKAGLSLDEIIGMPYWQVFPKSIAPPPNNCQITETNPNRKPEEIVTLDGNTYLSHTFNVKDIQGKYRFSVYVLENIPAQQKLHKEFDDNLERYRRLFESAPDAVFLVDAGTGQILDVNPAAVRLLEWSRAELISMNQSDLHPKADIGRKEFREHVAAGREGHLHKPSELQVLTASGRVVPVEITSCVFQLGDRQVIQGIFRDISLRKESENRLRLHAQILSQIHDSVISTDLNGRITAWNKSAEGLLGYRENEIIGQCIDFLFADGVNSKLSDKIIERVSKEGKFEEEVTMRHREGMNYFVHLTFSQLCDENGVQEGMIGYAIDITQRKHAEDKLHETDDKLTLSLNLLANIVESVPIRIFWKDKDLRFLGCNALFAKDAGFTSPRQLIGKTDFDTIWKDQAQQHHNEEQHIISSRISRLGYEESHTLPDGRMNWLNISKVPLRNDAGEIIGILGIYDDITKQKQSRLDLTLNERRLKEAQAIAHIGNWELDIERQHVFWSEELCRIYELEPGTDDASYETFFQRVHPEDRERVERAYQDCIETRKPYETTFRLLMPNGKVKYIRGKCETHDNGGLPLRTLGTMQDVTEQYLTEHALKRTNIALKAISSSISVLVHADNETSLLDETCHVIIDTDGYRFAWIGYVEPGMGKYVRPVAQAGYENGYVEKLKLTYADTERGRGPVGCSVRSGEPQVIHDTLSDDSFLPWRDAAIENGYRSVLSLPVKNIQGEVFAVMVIYSGKPDAFDDDAIALMENLAGDLGYGIIALRTRHERDHYLQAHLKSDERFKKVLVDTIRAISLTVEKRDPYTAGHQYDVAQLSIAIGRELGLDADRLEGLRLGAMIHDIGKICVPAEILNRPGRLSKAEFEIIKSHSEVGYDIIKDVQFPWPVAQMVLQHHERLDGSGYPNGLHGEEIILEARILSVADVVEAITSHRPYRPAVGLDKALLEIEKNRGVLYDPTVVDACLYLIRDKSYSFADDRRA